MEMLLHRRMLVLVAGVALRWPWCWCAAAQSFLGSAPEPVDVEDFTLPGCDFPVQADVSGKSKVTELPSGQTPSPRPICASP